MEIQGCGLQEFIAVLHHWVPAILVLANSGHVVVSVILGARVSWFQFGIPFFRRIGPLARVLPAYVVLVTVEGIGVEPTRGALEHEVFVPAGTVLLGHTGATDGIAEHAVVTLLHHDALQFCPDVAAENHLGTVVAACESWFQAGYVRAARTLRLCDALLSVHVT